MIYMKKFNEKKFDKDFVEQLLKSGEIKKFIQDHVIQKVKAHHTEHHDHHRSKEIYEKVKEHVNNFTNEL